MKPSERIALYLMLLFILSAVLVTSELPKLAHLLFLVPFGFCGGNFHRRVLEKG